MIYISAFGFKSPLKPWWLALLVPPCALFIQALMPALMEEDLVLAVAVPLYTVLLILTAWRSAALAASPRARLAGEVQNNVFCHHKN